MSFMFNPYPYDDPNAINVLSSGGIEWDGALTENGRIAEKLVQTATLGCGVICVDGYPTAPFALLAGLIEGVCQTKGIALTIIWTDELLRPEPELEALLASRYLPEDRVKDPVLLYGRICHEGYSILFDSEKVDGCASRLTTTAGTSGALTLLIGAGALHGSFRSLSDSRVFLDITQKTAMLNLKKGEYKNIGSSRTLTFKLLARRCYYVDFVAAAQIRGQTLETGTLEYYIAADNPDSMTMLSRELLFTVFNRALEYPLRCKPVYLEGIWGGHNITNRRRLPEDMRNCAWSFDMIPMEVSLALQFDRYCFEFPFYTLVQACSHKLMGQKSVDMFGNYFPLRFNYDDTWHSSGNMSIQCHPGEAYVKSENDELGRQDESYYIVEAAQEAKTYLGFKNGVDAEQFLADARRSETDHVSVDYDRYINAVPSIPGTQVMIPAGTVHASGRNQLVLEIGSLTMGSYTYKIYDYLRTDLDGKPRPIHSYHADKVLDRTRDADWVRANIVNEPRIIESGDGWEERILGEHELLYFSLRDIRLNSIARQSTNGVFHVLALVDGERLTVRSISRPERGFTMNYLDIVVIPASFGDYEIVNMIRDTKAVVHKTVLKL